MLRRLLTLAVTSVFFLPLLPLACDQTPRGEQGIDFYGEGSVDAGEVLSDAQGPCKEETDTGGTCVQLGGQGTLYTHLIVCTGNQSPGGLYCIGGEASTDGGVLTFCCETGLI
jgi:hypothetical protein